MATDKSSYNDSEHYGPEQGFNTVVQLNDLSLFNDDALNDEQIGPVLRAFADAPFIAYFAQFKSSSEEAEHFIHEPREALSPEDGLIRNTIGEMPRMDRVQTLVMNHEASLRHHVIRTMGIVEKASDAAQIVHKELPGGPHETAS